VSKLDEAGTAAIQSANVVMVIWCFNTCQTASYSARASAGRQWLINDGRTCVRNASHRLG
jgi:hypothetical protein